MYVCTTSVPRALALIKGSFESEGEGQRASGQTEASTSFLSVCPHPPEEMRLLIRGAVVRSDCGDGGEHSTGVVSPGRRRH